jgi:hypothetical protein
LAALAVRLLFCLSWRLGVLAVQYFILDVHGVLGGLGGSIIVPVFLGVLASLRLTQDRLGG